MNAPKSFLRLVIGTSRLTWPLTMSRLKCVVWS